MTRHEERLRVALEMRNRASSLTCTAMRMQSRNVLATHEAQCLVTAARALYAASTDLERDAVAVQQEYAA